MREVVKGWKKISLGKIDLNVLETDLIVEPWHKYKSLYKTIGVLAENSKEGNNSKISW